MSDPLDKKAENARELVLDYEPATYTFKPTSALVFAFDTKPNHNITFDTKPNHNITFHNQDGKQVGVLDFNGPEMTFTGDADESAKVFFDFIARSFKARLDQERADEREVIMDEWWMCVQSDLENGVKSLNERAAEEWKKAYPEISKFAAIIKARGNT